MTEVSQHLLPVTLLTGFLGSGKTTLLNRLLKQREFSRTAVVVNELGEIGLDHFLISGAEDMVLLENGCLCCVARNNLSGALASLLDRADTGAPIDRIVIETTGLADPAPILHVLMADRTLAARCRLNGVITVTDAVNGAATLEQYDEAARQVAVADQLLISKSDIASSTQIADLRAQLNQLAPGCAVTATVDGALVPEQITELGLYNPRTRSYAPARWLGLSSSGLLHEHEAHASDRHPIAHLRGLSTFCVVRHEPIPWKRVNEWIGTLTAVYGVDLLRVKGIINVVDWPGQPVAVHGVQHLFHPPVRLDTWPDSDHRTRVVFITRNINKAAVESALDCV